MLIRLSPALFAIGVLCGCTTVTTTAAVPPPPAPTPTPTFQSRFGTALPPWTPPLNVQGGADAAGLAIGPEKSPFGRFRFHLDVFVNGRAEKVPAGLGIDGKYISELHTRASDGVIEAEPSGSGKHYVLAQFFIEWGVRLGPFYLGGLTVDATHPLAAYVDGAPRSGDPGAIELTSGTEIAIVYGKAPERIPSTSSLGG